MRARAITPTLHSFPSLAFPRQVDAILGHSFARPRAFRFCPLTPSHFRGRYLRAPNEAVHGTMETRSPSNRTTGGAVGAHGLAVLLLGSPRSGKDTLARALCANFDFALVDCESESAPADPATETHEPATAYAHHAYSLPNFNVPQGRAPDFGPSSPAGAGNLFSVNTCTEQATPNSADAAPSARLSSAPPGPPGPSSGISRQGRLGEHARAYTSKDHSLSTCTFSQPPLP